MDSARGAGRGVMNAVVGFPAPAPGSDFHDLEAGGGAGARAGGGAGSRAGGGAGSRAGSGLSGGLGGGRVIELSSLSSNSISPSSAASVRTTSSAHASIVSIAESSVSRAPLIGVPAAAVMGTPAVAANGAQAPEAAPARGVTPSSLILQAIADPEAAANNCRDHSLRALQVVDVALIAFGVALFACGFFNIEVFAFLICASGFCLVLEGGKSIYLTRECIRLEGFERQIQHLETQVNRLSTEIDDHLTPEINRLGGVVDVITATSVTLGTQVHTLTEQNERFTGEVATMHTENDRYRTENDRLTTSVTQLSDQVALCARYLDNFEGLLTRVEQAGGNLERAGTVTLERLQGIEMVLGEVLTKLNERIEVFGQQNVRLTRSVEAMQVLTRDWNMSRDLQDAIIRRQESVAVREEAVALKQEENNRQQTLMLREQSKIIGDMERLEVKQRELVQQLEEMTDKHKKITRRAAFFSAALHQLKIRGELLQMHEALDEDTFLLAAVAEINPRVLEEARLRLRNRQASVTPIVARSSPRPVPAIMDSVAASRQRSMMDGAARARSRPGEDRSQLLGRGDMREGAPSQNRGWQREAHMVVASNRFGHHSPSGVVTANRDRERAMWG